MTRVSDVLAALVVLALSATACTSDDARDPGSPSSSATTATSEPQEVDTGRVSPGDLPAIPEVKQSAGAVKDSTMGECKVAPGDQEVTGSVRNPTRTPLDYVVVVSWVTPASDVLARGVSITRDLGAGAEAQVTVRASVPAGVSDCTFYVVRGQIA